MLESEVSDADALNAYLFHPLHQALVADLKPYFAWAAVDYTALLSQAEKEVRCAPGFRA